MEPLDNRTGGDIVSGLAGSIMVGRGHFLHAAAILSLTLGGCASTHHGALRPIPAGSGYVALGSSFAAGAGVGPLRQGTPVRCGRTTNNYATLLSQKLNLSLTDASCGGAMTANILAPWNELPAQIDAVTADTRLVTITIGGNDVGYAMNLIGGSCRAGAAARPGTCPPERRATESAYLKLEQNLNEIGRQVAIRAPQARLVFVQYVTLVPPTRCDAAALTPEDAQSSRATGIRLAEITARAARSTGALLLPADILSRDHTPCSAVPWSNGMAAGYDMRHGSPWHPNAAGHAAIADALERLLTK